MKKKLVKFLILPPLVFLSFQNFFFNISGENYVSHVDRIIQEFVKEMEKKYNFHCTATGGSMPYDVEKISIQFILQKNGEIDNARTLIVKATERFLEIINTNEDIRPYLRDYPFQASRIEIGLFFEINDAFHQNENHVDYVHQGNSKIFYRTRKENKSILINIEPYEEAKQLVETYTNTNKENAN